MSVINDIIRQLTRLPRPGLGAANLTDRDKLALAIAAGVPVETEIEGGMLTIRSLCKFGVADRGDGGYIVAMCAREDGQPERPTAGGSATRGGRDVAPRADGGS